MSAGQPLLDPVLWGRWLLAGAALLWLPGHLLVGRHLRALDAAGRAVLSCGAGLALAVVTAPLATAIGLPWRPGPYLLLALAVGWAAGRAAAHRAAILAWTDGLPPLPPAGRLALLAAVVSSASLLIAGYGGFAAPPHVHDASNHAFLTLRIFESGRADAGAVFAGQHGRPAVGYLPGWHAAAALVAQLGGVAPYVATWFLPLALAALLPAAAALLWRAWGLPAVAVAGGALLLTGNEMVPGGILEWGGFGQIGGLFLLPVLLLALRGLWRRPGAAAGLGCGALWAALARVHAGEAYAALFLAPLVWARTAPGEPAARRGRRGAALLLALAAFAALIGPDAWRLGSDYAGWIARDPPAPPERFGYCLEKYWNAGGRALGLKILTALGLAHALWRRRWRPLAALSLVLGAIFVARAAWRDPFTGWLTVPFYGQAARLHYLQALLLPALAALPLAALHARLGGGGSAGGAGRGRAGVVVAALAAAALVPAWPGVLRDLRLDRGSVPFTPAEYALALDLRQVLPPTAVVANYWDDGSTWAMHVSGRRFLQPLSWPLRDPQGADLRQALRGLRERPWPPAAAALRAVGVEYVYVSDRHWPPSAPPPARRADFDADPRFEALRRGGAAALYRVRWEAEPAPGEAPLAAPMESRRGGRGGSGSVAGWAR